MSVRVLVVDDEPDVEMLFRQQFRREVREGQFVLDFALSADEALTKVRDAEGVTIILLVSDINMPGMSGLDLLPKIKAKHPKVPVIMKRTAMRLRRGSLTTAAQRRCSQSRWTSMRYVQRSRRDFRLSRGEPSRPPRCCGGHRGLRIASP